MKIINGTKLKLNMILKFDDKIKQVKLASKKRVNKQNPSSDDYRFRS